MIIDILLLIMLSWALWKGVTRGLIIAVASFLGFIVGLAAALKLSAWLAQWLQQQTGWSGNWLPFLAFLLIMLGVAFALRQMANALETMLDMALLGWANKLGGFLLYSFIGLLAFSSLLFFTKQMHVLPESTFASSASWPYIEPLGPHAISFIGAAVPFLKDTFQQLEVFFAGVAKTQA
jgi:membrane protein required for colicin V production